MTFEKCSARCGGRVLFIAAIILACTFSMAAGVILGALQSAFIIASIAAFAGFAVVMLILLVITIIIASNSRPVNTRQ